MKQIITLSPKDRTYQRLSQAIELLSDPNIRVHTYIQVGGIYGKDLIVTYNSGCGTIQSIYVECITVEDTHDDSRYRVPGDKRSYVTIDEVLRRYDPAGYRAEPYVKWVPAHDNLLLHDTLNFTLKIE